MNDLKDREDALLSDLGRLAKQQWDADEKRGFPDSPDPLAALNELEQARIVQALAPAAPRRSLLQRPAFRAAVVALAAGLAAVMLRPFGGSDTLPGYQIELRGGGQELRSAPVEPPAGESSRYRAGDRLIVVLQPKAAHDVEVQAKVRLDGPGVADWKGKTETDPSGAIRLIQRVPETWPPGEWTMTVWVGPASEAEPSADAPTWQRHLVQFRIETPEPDESD